jgi:hypothetical protein
VNSVDAWCIAAVISIRATFAFSSSNRRRGPPRNCHASEKPEKSGGFPRFTRLNAQQRRTRSDGCPVTAHATTGAALYSLIETAKANDLEPMIYLRWLFATLPSVDPDDAEAIELVACPTGGVHISAQGWLERVRRNRPPPAPSVVAP